MASSNEFPHFDTGDVKIVLSQESHDTLILHSSTLTTLSSFLKASLDDTKWSHNKCFQEAGGKAAERRLKLLELDFEGQLGFPLLIGRVSILYRA